MTKGQHHSHSLEKDVLEVTDEAPFRVAEHEAEPNDVPHDTQRSAPHHDLSDDRQRVFGLGVASE
jgi:hypothetical protein